jgi:hypothetical protein
VELGDLGFAPAIPLASFVVEDACELVDGLLLPQPDQVGVQPMPACQLGDGVLAPDGLQGDLGLELSRIAFPFRHRGSSSSWRSTLSSCPIFRDQL